MSKESHVLDGYRFAMRMRIQPEIDPNGDIQRFMPQERYAESAVKRLAPHGGGPFCRFSAPGLPASPAVYGLTIDGEVVYVGKTVNLADKA